MFLKCDWSSVPAVMDHGWTPVNGVVGVSAPVPSMSASSTIYWKDRHFPTELEKSPHRRSSDAHVRTCSRPFCPLVKYLPWNWHSRVQTTGLTSWPQPTPVQPAEYMFFPCAHRVLAKMSRVLGLNVATRFKGLKSYKCVLSELI